jgi:peptidoglycan/LPS O-acetylase OafA/YrhL
MGYVAMRLMIDIGIMPWLAILLAFMLAITVSVLLHVAVELPSQRAGKQKAAFRPLRDRRVTP